MVKDYKEFAVNGNILLGKSDPEVDHWDQILQIDPRCFNYPAIAMNEIAVFVSKLNEENRE